VCWIQTNRCTPTLEAYLAGERSLQESLTHGTRDLLLITDGPPTLGALCEPGVCQESTDELKQGVVDAVAAAHLAGFGTYVLGVPGTEPHVPRFDDRWWLSQAAEAGGAASLPCDHFSEPYCHFDLTMGATFVVESRAAIRLNTAKAPASNSMMEAHPIRPR
jgi:hypothetical protein